MNYLSRLVLSALVLATVHTGAQASDLTARSSNRMDHAVGAYASLFGDPIGLFGLNAGFHPTDFLRVVGGVGLTPEMGPITQTAVSFGTGLKFMVPTWNFTPVIGTNLSLLFVGGASGLVQYENLGVEYTASNGFHIGAGVNGLFVVAGNTDAVDRVTPYLNIGVFF